MTDPGAPMHLPPEESGNLPVRPLQDAAAVTLLRDLHSNLWSSLKNTLDVDRVALGALILANFGGMVLTIIAASAGNVVPLIASVGALGVVDLLLHRTFKTSQTEARRIVALLTDIYTDHGLAPYFDQMRDEFYVERYRIRLLLCPILFVLAVVLGLAFGFGS
jgi:hypothetical protein